MIYSAILVFMVWTLSLYWIHRLAHTIPLLKQVHIEHHRYIRLHNTKWHWNNLFLVNDNLLSTLDLWISEVIPTIIISYITGHWWITVFYYIWAAFLQENLEHNTNNNYYPFTAGKWHLVHHSNITRNFGLFTPIWDKFFRTESKNYT